jgi:hypothetical protein
MAKALLDDEIDPYARYLGDPMGSVSVAVGAPSIYDNAKPIPMPKVDLAGLSPDLKERIDAASAAWLADKELNPKGEAFPITSGFRDISKQSQLYASKDQNPNLVAPPGYSKHEKGMGIDILSHVPDKFLNTFGLHRPYGSKDPVHVEVNPAIDWKNVNQVNLAMDEGLDPSSAYLKEQGVYTPTIKETMQSQFAGLRKDIGSANYYTNTLPKQVAALADVAAETLPAAVKFVGEPFAKLVDKLGDTKVATEALDKVTSFASRPFGKAFGITNDPAYNAEAATRIMDYVGQNMDKGAEYISKETGLPKSDVAWFMNAAMIKAAPYAAKGAKKAYEVGAEQLPKAGEQIKAQYETAKGKVQELIPELKGEENPNLRSVGAAELSAGQLRQAKARELLDPIDLSRDQYTRNFKDVNWAREKAKDATTGEPLRQKYAQDNQKLINNLDLEIQATGAQKTGIERGQLGQELNDVVAGYQKNRYQEVKDKYTEADTAGETLQQVPYKAVTDYIDNIEAKRPTQYDQNPILKMVKEDLKANDPNGTGAINLRQYEDIKQLINAETEYGTSNGFHGSKIRSAINEATKDAGGTLYKEANALNSRYMKEFEENPVIRDITAIKKGTTERKIAIENLVEDSMLKGPRSRVEELFKTLENAGPEGQAMINELRGVVAEQIASEATKGVGRDINGNPIVSPIGLNNIIQKLDKSGKLDLIFGKKGAERYRTLNDVTKDVKTVPEGSVNYSGTASQIKNLVVPIVTDLGASAMAGVPLPVTLGGTMAYKYVKGRKEANKISEFINYGKEK